MDDIIKGELHENIIRQDFSFSERQAILKEVEKKRIGHKVAGGKVDKLTTFQNENKGQSSAEIVTKYTGKSSTQIKKEKKLLETIENNPKLNYLVNQIDNEEITVNRAYKIIDDAENMPDDEGMIDGIYFHDYGVGYSNSKGIIQCFLCLIDQACPDEYTPKDTVIPLIRTDHEWSMHFLIYHAKVGRPGYVLDKYIPYLGDKSYEPGSFWYKMQQKEYRKKRKEEKERKRNGVPRELRSSFTLSSDM